MTSEPLLIAIMGPTASGKTDLAETIAERIDAQLINADAFQIYRGMDIGTAKPTRADKYELVDIREPNESFGVGEFVSLTTPILQSLWDQRRNTIIVGGTGLYIRALFEEYSEMAPLPDPDLRFRLNQKSLDELIAELLQIDPSLAQKIDLKNRVRVQRSLERIHADKPSLRVSLPLFQKFKFGVARDPIETSDRITRRVQSMVEAGWVREVRQLRDAGFSPADPGFRALGYRAMWQHVDGEVKRAGDDDNDRRYAALCQTAAHVASLRAEPNDA